jgi:ABC-type multidrug transport system fused ATPase/permease subunit
MSYLLFVSFSLLGGELSLKEVHTAMAIMNLYRFPMEILPLARTSWEEATKSFRRIRDFLILPEVPCVLNNGGDNIDNNIENENNDDDGHASGGGVMEDSGVLLLKEDTDRAEDLLVHIDKASFAYGVMRNTQNENENENNKSDASYKTISAEATDESGLELPVNKLVDNTSSSSGSIALANISLSIRKGELVAIVGSVGSGKTSLLSAMLKQMECVQGSQSVLGNVAYVSQEHWIQNKTLRENVLFFNAFDEEKYIAAIDASQLSNDLIMLPSADFTVIGERGINLSGGQKARVNIARSLYAKDDVDLVMMDDPLAAVDAHVGKAIFQEAILHTLKDKARVVVFSSNYHFFVSF